MTIIQHAIDRLVAGHDLDAAQAYAVFAAMMDGQGADVEIAALLTALRLKEESVAELVGAARAMHERAARVTTKHQRLLDTCGTGGDELSTFNISTATALVVAACGVAVPKHGNRSVSSKSGSADVLEQLGVDIGLSAEKVGRCVDELKIGFCFAPMFHSALKHLATVRRQLRFRTIFNLLGPLTNPAGAPYQLLGTGRKETAHRLARALAEFGRKHAYVVCGAEQLDEVSLWGTTTAFEVTGPLIVERQWTADTFGLAEAAVADVRVASAAESAAMIRGILDGAHGPPRDIVLANAAAGLLAAEVETNPRQAAARAAHAIDSGSVRELLARLVEMTNRLATEHGPAADI